MVIPEEGDRIRHHPDVTASTVEVGTAPVSVLVIASKTKVDLLLTEFHVNLRIDVPTKR